MRICWYPPPWQTAYGVLDSWAESGATELAHAELRRQCRIAAGRKPEPTAAVIDSQSVKAAETVRSARTFRVNSSQRFKA